MLGPALAAGLAAFASCTVYGPDLLVGTAGATSSTGGGGASGGGRTGSGGGLADSGRNGAGVAGSAGSAVAPEAGQGGEAGDDAGGAGGEAGGNSGTSGRGGSGGSAGQLNSGGRGTAGAGRGGGAGGPGGAPTGGRGSAAGGVAGSAGASSGAGGGAGVAGSGGSGGSGETCPGCARLSVPLAATTDRTHFRIYLPVDVDFSAATLVMRVRVHAGTGGQIQAYVQHGGTPDYNLIYSGGRDLDTLGAWTDISWDVGASTLSFDHTTIRRIGIEVLGGTSSSWTNPTVIHVDSITVTGATPALAAYDFADATTVSSGPTSADHVLLLALDDDLVSGSTLGWLGP